MKAIPLSQGFSSFVDDEDFDFLNQFLWHAAPSKGNIYAHTSSLGGVYMHVLLLLPEPPLLVRHLNDIGLHNWRSNLKISDQSENLRHATRRLGRKSNYPRGVTKHTSGKYQAQMTYSGKVHYLGLHDTPEEAAFAFSQRYKKIFGDN